MDIRKDFAAFVVIVIVAVSGILAYTYIHETNINAYDNANVPDDFHKITLFVNYPEAGKILDEKGTVRHGAPFFCTVTPRASGYVFEGWFCDNTLVSKSLAFSYKVLSDVKLEARFYKDTKAAFIITQTDIKTPLDMTLTPTAYSAKDTRAWEIKDLTSGDILPYRDSGKKNGGITFTVEHGGPISLSLTTTHNGVQGKPQVMTIVINENVVKNFEWRYQEDMLFPGVSDLLSINDGQVTWSVSLPFTEYYQALIDPIPRSGTAGAYDVIGEFITSDSQVISQMAEELGTFSENMSKIDQVNFVLKFVQSIEYKLDIDSKGVNEYYKLPLETLWEQNGDCEDHAILLATLLKELGYKVVLYHVYIYSGDKIVGAHVAAGVAVEGGSGYSTMGEDGVEYFYCEATAEVGTSWLNDANVGYKPDGFEVIETWMV